MREKLQKIADEYHELTHRLADPDVLADPNQISSISQRVAELKPTVEIFDAWDQAVQELEGARELAAEADDPEMREMAEQEVLELEQRIDALEADVKKHLVPRDPNDKKNAVLEIRAGTGGDEATLFAADLFRMYSRYAETQNWKVEIAESSTTEVGGVREIIALVEGTGPYSRLKFESGVHRVQRVPETESQGRIHTSACTVAVLPEAEEVEIEIDPNDLRIDTFRSQGAGGQHVNTTDSAVRITHIPTDIVVSCQDEKSQHKNRTKAMRILRARVHEKFESEAKAERAAQRKSMVGSGDRSERIRTYNFPQNRVTDHRINLTSHKLDQVLQGDIDEIIDALTAADTAERLAEATETDEA